MASCVRPGPQVSNAWNCAPAPSRPYNMPYIIPPSTYPPLQIVHYRPPSRVHQQCRPAPAPTPPPRIPPTVRVEIRNRTSDKIVIPEYSLDHLRQYSGRVQRDYANIKASGTFALPTTNALEPASVGVDIVLRWLKTFPAQGFSPNFRGQPQLTSDIAFTFSKRQAYLPFSDTLRILEALTRLDLQGPLSRQYVLKGELQSQMSDNPILPDDFIALWHIFKDLDPKFAQKAVRIMASHLWHRNQAPHMIMVWQRCCEDELLYDEMMKALARIDNRAYEERQAAEKVQALARISEDVFGDYGAVLTDVRDGEYDNYYYYDSDVDIAVPGVATRTPCKSDAIVLVDASPCPTARKRCRVGA